MIAVDIHVTTDTKIENGEAQGVPFSVAANWRLLMFSRDTDAGQVFP